jgi:hypothetical protein
MSVDWFFKWQSNFHENDLKSKIWRFRRSPREGPNSFPVLPEPEETSGRSPLEDRNSGERKCARGNQKKMFFVSIFEIIFKFFYTCDHQLKSICVIMNFKENIH